MRQFVGTGTRFEVLQHLVLLDDVTGRLFIPDYAFAAPEKAVFAQRAGSGCLPVVVRNVRQRICNLQLSQHLRPVPVAGSLVFAFGRLYDVVGLLAIAPGMSIARRVDSHDSRLVGAVYSSDVFSPKYSLKASENDPGLENPTSSEMAWGVPARFSSRIFAFSKRISRMS